MKKTVLVCGVGYIGLPTACYISQNKSFKVVGYTPDASNIEKLKRDELPFQEKGLEELFKKSKLEFTDSFIDADVYVVCVPTPVNEGVADLSAVHDVLSKIIRKKDPVIVIESTCPVGTMKEIAKKYKFKNLVVATERAIPGRTIEEMKNNDRVIGVREGELAVFVKNDLYKFVEGDIFLDSWVEAEIVKLIENASRDNQIACANTVSRICHHLKLKPEDVIGLANKHPRVNILDYGI